MCCFGLYEKIIDSLLHFFKDVKNNIKFIFNIGIGVFIGVFVVGNLLKIAFDNFKNCEFPNKELQQLRTEFAQFETQKEPIDYDDIYTRLALFPFIKNQEEYKDFFVGFDSNPEIRAQKMPKYEALKEEYKDEIEFYKFKQFLAHKTLIESKELINSQNIKRRTKDVFIL